MDLRKLLMQKKFDDKKQLEALEAKKHKKSGEEEEIEVEVEEKA